MPNPGDPVKVDFALTLKDVATARRRLTFDTESVVTLVLVLLANLALALVWQMAELAIWAIQLSALCVYFGFFYAPRKAFETTPILQGHQTWVIRNDGIHFESRNDAGDFLLRSDVSWKSMWRVQETKEAFLLLMSRNQVAILPKRFLDGPSQILVREYVRVEERNSPRSNPISLSRNRRRLIDRLKPIAGLLALLVVIAVAGALLKGWESSSDGFSDPEVFAHDQEVLAQYDVSYARALRIYRKSAISARQGQYSRVRRQTATIVRTFDRMLQDVQHFYDSDRRYYFDEETRGRLYAATSSRDLADKLGTGNRKLDAQITEYLLQMSDGSNSKALFDSDEAASLGISSEGLRQVPPPDR